MGFNFRSEFYFDIGNELKVVRLVLPDSSRCEELKAAMDGIYGQRQAGSEESEVWLDTEHGNKVRVTTTVPPCFIAYVPLASAGGNGL